MIWDQVCDINIVISSQPRLYLIAEYNICVTRKNTITMDNIPEGYLGYFQCSTCSTRFNQEEYDANNTICN